MRIVEKLPIWPGKDYNIDVTVISTRAPGRFDVKLYQLDDRSYRHWVAVIWETRNPERASKKITKWYHQRKMKLDRDLERARALEDKAKQ